MTEGILFGFQKNSALLAQRRLHLNIDQDKINKTRDIEVSENDDFLAVKPNSDRQAYAHHLVTENPAEQCPEFLKERGSTQNKPLLQHFTQPQNLQHTFHPITHSQWLN